MKHSLIPYYRAQFEAGEGCTGRTVGTWAGEIKGILKKNNCRSILDYGCGDALAYKEDGLRWPVPIIHFYDPAHPDYCKRPMGPYDCVICCDVAEHVPEDEVDEFLEDVFSQAEKVVFITVCCREAKRWLADGINAHVTIKPFDWWLDKIMAHAESEGVQCVVRETE